MLLFLLILSCSSASEISVTKTKVHDYRCNDDKVALMEMINNYRDSKRIAFFGIIEHISYLSSLHNMYRIEKFKHSYDGFIQR